MVSLIHTASRTKNALILPYPDLTTYTMVYRNRPRRTKKWLPVSPSSTGFHVGWFCVLSIYHTHPLKQRRHGTKESPRQIAHCQKPCWAYVSSFGRYTFPARGTPVGCESCYEAGGSGDDESDSGLQAGDCGVQESREIGASEEGVGDA